MNTSLKTSKKPFITWRKILVLVVIFLITMPVVFLVQISASSSVVLEAGELDVSSSAHAKALAVRLRDMVLSTSNLEEFSAKQDEINGLIQLAMRGIPR
ncbi:MAG: hypothetical protein P8Z75_12890, partial [Gammaproteobacteria bacterium]